MRLKNIPVLILAFLAFTAAVEPQGETYSVYRVVDGDTVALRNDERVKLIGIDAPEAINSLKLHRDAKKLGVKSFVVKNMGLQAKAFTANLVEGQNVRLEFEGPRRDRNGRIRAYAYLEDGTFVNAEILRQGYATVAEEPGLKQAVFFQNMQQEAMENERGLWKFIGDREIQLMTDEYKNLDEAQRKEVLQYIRQLKSGVNAPQALAGPAEGMRGN